MNTVHMNPLSQADRIYSLLKDGQWVCTSQMYALYIADVRRRLCDLKDRGEKLVNRPCEQHPNHKKSKEWKLLNGMLF